MSVFSPAQLEQVRAASDIVEVIGAYVPLKRNGANFVALCPFHKERTPSFNVNPSRQIYHCFGCHKGGDVFRFVQDYENLSFPEAVRRLAERARIVLEADNRPGEAEGRAHKDVLRQMHDQIANRWHAVLLNDAAGAPGRAYLERRGVSAEAVKTFRLGFAPEAWDDTVNWAKSKGYEPALVEEAGLILHKEGDPQRYYDRFRGRLMFPINDEQGRTIGFSGRVIAGDERTAKYVNSPETPIFTKGRVIYGLDKARRAILDAGTAIVCEGQLDLIACYTAGVQNVVAPQGTALTADHARILKRYAGEVVLCFDADAAGRKAAVRAFDELLGAGLTVRVVTLPAPHDPDSYIREFGAAGFRERVAQGRSFFDFYLDHLAATNDVQSDRGRVTVARAMAEALRKAASPVLTDLYLQKTAHRLGVSAAALRAEFRAVRSAPTAALRESATVEPKPMPEAPRPSNLEFWLLRLLFLEDRVDAEIAAQLNPAWIQHPGVRDLVTRRLLAVAEGRWHGVPGFLDGIEDPAARCLLTEALAEKRTLPEPERQLRDTVRSLRLHDLDRQIAALDRVVNDTSAAEGDREAAYRKKVELGQLRRALPANG